MIEYVIIPIIEFLKPISPEIIVTAILTLIMLIYFIKCCVQKAQTSPGKNMRYIDERLAQEYIGGFVKYIFTFMHVFNEEFAAGVRACLEEKKLSLSRDSIEQVLWDNFNITHDKADKIKNMTLTRWQGPKLVDAIYKNAQLAMCEGPEYDKLSAHIQKEIGKEVNAYDMLDLKSEKPKSFTPDYNYMPDFSFVQQLNDQIQRDMQQHIEQHILIDMQLQMHQQMIDMNNMDMFGAGSAHNDFGSGFGF